MAVHYEPPTCPFCGAPTAKAVFHDQTNIPPQLQLIGDGFSHFESIKHDCPERKKSKTSASIVYLAMKELAENYEKRLKK